MHFFCFLFVWIYNIPNECLGKPHNFMNLDQVLSFSGERERERLPGCRLCRFYPPPLLLLTPTRFRPSFFAIIFECVNGNGRNSRNHHFRTCGNFYSLDILLSLRYLRHFPLTRNVKGICILDRGFHRSRH